MKATVMWFLGALGAIALAHFARLTYSVLWAEREEKLKGYLARASSTRKHNRFVRAFVGALRGRAERNEVVVRNSVVVFLATCSTVVVFAAAVTTFTAFDRANMLDAKIESRMRDVEGLLATLDASAKQNREMQDELVKPAEERKQITPPSLEESLEMTARTISAMREELAANKQAIQGQRATAAESHSRVGFLRWPLLLALAAMIAVTLFLILSWHPITLMTRIFAFETSRFMDRMQTIASPDEIARLARAEVGVSDEKSLKAFVGLAVTVARNHDIAPLALRFDLWDAFGTQQQQAHQPAPI
jgi:hypothetical protein